MMQFVLFVSISMFLTAIAAQNDIDSGSFNSLHNDGFVSDISADANVVVDFNDVPDGAGDSIATDPCGEIPNSESFLNSGTGFDSAGIDSAEYSRRDLIQGDINRFQQPGSFCQNRDTKFAPPEQQESPSKHPYGLPEWARKCLDTPYLHALCCIGKPYTTEAPKRDVQNNLNDVNVEKCIGRTFYRSFFSRVRKIVFGQF